MVRIVIAGSHVLIDLAGILLLWCALFLYENEAGQIENTLDAWWKESAVRAEQSASVLAAFVATVAAATERFLRALFGPALLSVQSLIVSACATIGSLNAALFYRTGEAPSRVFMVGAALVVIALASDYCGRRLWPAVVFTLMTVGTLAYQWVWWTYAPRAPMSSVLNMFTFGTFPVRIIGPVTVVLMASVGCNMLIIALARWLVRQAESHMSLWRILELLVVSTGVPLAFVWLPVWGPSIAFGDIRVIPNEWTLIDAVYTGYASVPATSVFVVFLALALSMLLHRLFWGAVRRPLYAIGAKFHLFRQTRLMGLSGLTVLGLRHGAIAEPLFRMASKSGIL